MLDHTSGHHDPKKLTQKINHHTSNGGSDGSIYHYFQWRTWKHTSCFYNSRAYRVRYSDSQRWYTLTKGHTKYLSDLWAMTAFCLKKQEESHHQHSMDNCLWSSGEVEILLTLREKKYVWDPGKKRHLFRCFLTSPSWMWLCVHRLTEHNFRWVGSHRSCFLGTDHILRLSYVEV